MDQDPQVRIVSGVGFTALAVAAGRAVESSRPDRLIEDPLAAAFVAAAHSPVPLPLRWPGPGTALSDQEVLLLHGAAYVGLRSRFCDDYLRRACSEGIGQVVVLAAGLDTRAFRLGWLAGARLFEIDQPSVLEFKDAVLRQEGALPQCARTVVGTDLRDDWAGTLRGSGFEASLPAVWLAEGLLQYLPADAERALFEHVNALSAPGSHIVVEHSANLAVLAGGQNGQRLQEISGRTGIAVDQFLDVRERPDPAVWLAGRGWSVTSHPVTAIAERYHRNLAEPGLPRPGALPARPEPKPVAAARQASTAFLCARR